MKTGTHLLVNLHGCPKELLCKSEIVLQLLNETVSEAKLTKVGETVHQFQPEGVTAVILLAESHISIHTWPEKDGFAALDIFTCGNEGNAEEALKILIEKFKPQKIDKQKIERGLCSEIRVQTHS